MITAPDPAEVSAVAPTLAWIASLLIDRPYYAAGQPYPVSVGIYQRAEIEMKAVLRARGWGSPGQRVEIGRPNFILQGTPIVCGDDA